jgi:U3 small nucleolar RNA-associated protein 14
MQRFAKGDIRAGVEISKQAQDARDEQVALRRVIQGRNVDQDEDSEAVDLSDSDDDGQKGLAQRTVDKAKKLTNKELDGLKQGDEIPTTGLFGMPFMRNAIKEKRESAKAEAQSLLNELEGVGARLDAKDVDSGDEQKQNGTGDHDNGIIKKRREFTPEELEKASKEIDDLMLDQGDVTQAQKSSVDGALTVRGVEAQKLPMRTSSSDPSSLGAGVATSIRARSPAEAQDVDNDNPWLAAAESATKDVDEENPWLQSALPNTEAISQAPVSSAEGEDSKKKKKRKGAAAAAEPGGKQKRRRLADNEAPNSEPHTNGAELLNVLDADAEEARQQRDLVRATFIEGTQADDFDDEKDELEREQEEKNKPEELVGWGSWTGEGVKPRAAPKGKASGKGKSGKGKHGKGTTKQAAEKPAHVVINQGDAATPACQAKFFVDKVPFPFKNPQQYDQEMRMPSGPEWNTLSQHLQRVKPKVFTKVGAIVPPLQYVKHLAPEQRESAINTWAAAKQPKRLKARF